MMWSRLILWLVPVAILIAAGCLNYTVLVEYYGQGPPYYGGTVNMDKWESPLPFVLAVNLIAVAALVGFVLVFRRLGKPSRR